MPPVSDGRGTAGRTRHLAKLLEAGSLLTLGIVLLSTLALTSAVAARSADQRLDCPAPGNAVASEACVRQELGIPPDAQRVAIVSQSSHLDWDWRYTFDEYFEGPLMDPLLFF